MKRVQKCNGGMCDTVHNNPRRDCNSYTNYVHTTLDIIIIKIAVAAESQCGVVHTVDSHNIINNYTHC